MLGGVDGWLLDTFDLCIAIWKTLLVNPAALTWEKKLSSVTYLLNLFQCILFTSTCTLLLIWCHAELQSELHDISVEMPQIYQPVCDVIDVSHHHHHLHDDINSFADWLLSHVYLGIDKMDRKQKGLASKTWSSTLFL